MLLAEIYSIDPFIGHMDATFFIQTLFGDCVLGEYAKIDFPPISLGYVQDDSARFYLLAGPSQRHLKDILPYYLDGELKDISNIIGYLFFLHLELLDFDAKQGDLEIDTRLNWHELHERQRHSSYIYTMCAKDFFDYFQQAAPGEPYVIVLAYKGDKPDDKALEAKGRHIREGLSLDESVRILPCDLNDKSECKQVVMTLMDIIGDFPHRNQVMPLIEAL